NRHTSRRVTGIRNTIKGSPALSEFPSVPTSLQMSLALSLTLDTDQVSLEYAHERIVNLQGTLAVTVSTEYDAAIDIVLQGVERLTNPTVSSLETVTQILDIQSSTFDPHNPVYFPAGTTLLPFTFSIPASTPPSFIHKSGSISYTVHASVSYDGYVTKATQPVCITRTCSPTSTVFWGMTKDKQWQYEFEVPRVISLDEEESVMVTARLRRIEYKKTEPVKKLNNCCLVGCQLWEFMTLSFPTENVTVHTQTIDPYTRFEDNPSLSWAYPMKLSMHLAPGRIRPDLNSPCIGVKHLLHLTIATSSVSLEDVTLDFPVIVTGACKLTEEAVQDVGCSQYTFAPEVIRRDSGIDMSSMLNEELSQGKERACN
ncbi:hypothetical protein BC937DRAFT_94819, partial [Endogone sp. FLAS-F59071]